VPEFDDHYRLLRPGPAARTLEAYRVAGGYTALERALTSLAPEQIIQEVARANLRGRGGAGIQTAQKWGIVRSYPGEPKYVVCNAYDADPRARIARTLLEEQPHLVIEGIALAAYAVGAAEAYLFTRSTYQEAIASAQAALTQALEVGIIGENAFDTDYTLTMTVVAVDVGFIGGEETTMLEVIKGKRAMPQQRPPYPSQFGLWDRPTLVNGVETLANIPAILRYGADGFKELGTADSPGTKLFTVYGPEPAGEPRVIELPLGWTIRQALRHATIAPNERDIRAVVVGGAEGGALPVSLLDTPLDYESLEAAGAIMGAGTIEVLPANTCMVAWARERSQYLTDESCGKCVPCRLGMKRIASTLEGIISDLGDPDDLALLAEFSHYVPDGSLCGFGVHAPNPLKTAIRYFSEDFRVHIEEQRCPQGTCLPLRVHRYVTKGVL
jgi:NADH:ubiquinone oxidoreductase subunit F (NADH-binding)